MRVAIYARTACLTQNLNSAVELQLEALRNYATQNGMEIVEEFTDAGYSGLQRDRPGLNRMCEAAERRGFDVLLTRDPARLARNAVWQISLWKDLEQWGVRTIFLEDRPCRRSAVGKRGPEEWFAAERCGSEELSKPGKELARGIFRSHVAPSEPFGQRASIVWTNFLPGEE